MKYHVPALLNECIDGLNIRPDGNYVDVTFGGGGHSIEILKHINKGRLIAFDQDGSAEQNRPVDDRFLFLNQNFRFLKNNLRYAGLEVIDGLIADLGVSFHQFDIPERGFSFRHDSYLDMRMNQVAGVTAADLLNGIKEADIAHILREYGELTNSKKIAGAIVKWRKNSPFTTTGTLIDAIRKFTPRKNENKFYARVFQALRIEVNREMEFLKEMLLQGLDILKPGGRMVIITYHSLEDRIVKNFFRTGNFEGVVNKDFYGHSQVPLKLINRKVIVPTEDEIKRNSRSRSAKLRIAEKI